MAQVALRIEQLEEQVRGAFVQQQFTEKQSRARAQEVVDDSSSAIVERLTGTAPDQASLDTALNRVAIPH